MESIDPDILSQVRALLIRDLKLPADRQLPEDMPLFGSDIDLDSLDMLLLVTSLERQFGVRIASRTVGQQVFATVGSLARYVQENRSTPIAAAPSTATPTDWLAQLPHGPGFRFVSTITEVTPGQSARGVWNLTGNEPFFADHFPNNPIVPGVLLAEALAQLSGLAGPPTSQPGGMLAHIDVRFLAPVRPPAQIELLSSFTGALGSLQNFQVALAREIQDTQK